MGAVALDSRRRTPLTVTPWGRAETLRSRRLRPGPSNSAEDVARNHRERLFGATVAVVATHGYEATRVADILDVAGMSRSAFYRYFDNKEQCFLATLDALAGAAAELVGDAYARDDQPWDERLRTALEELVGMIVSQPAAARLWFIEIYSAGPEAIDRIEWLADRVERQAIDAIDATPERAGMPPEGVRAVLGGLRQIIHTRLRHGREGELVELVPDLLDWALSYQTPPARLRKPRKPPALGGATPDPDEQRRRILVAVTDLVAEQSYQEMTISEIADRAAISLSTFYSRFDGKHEAFLAAIDDGERQLLEVTLPAFQLAPDWASAMRDGLYAFFAFNAAHPAAAKVAGLSIFTGGAQAFDRHEHASARFQGMLRSGYQAHPQPSPIVAEAIGSSIAALIYQQVRRKGARRLYEVAAVATFIALAPFVGPRDACALANEGWDPAAL